MSAGVWAASILCSTLRGIILCSLWGCLMPRRFSRFVTYGAICGAYLLLDSFTSLLVNTRWVPLWAILFYVTIFLLAFNLHRGQRLAKTAYIFLGLSLFFMSGMPVTFFYGVLPDNLRKVINNPMLLERAFSAEFFGFAVVTGFAFFLSAVLSHGIIRLYKRVRFQETLPVKAKFMIVPASQFFLILAYMLFAYHHQILASRENVYFLLYLLIACVICFASDVFLFITLRDMDRKAELEVKLRLMEQAQRADYTQFQTVDFLYRQEREFRHDINNKLITAQTLLEQGETAALSALLQDISGTVVRNKQTNYCENALINAVLNNKVTFAQSHGVVVEVRALVGELPVPKTDLCSLFSNIMDNATEACQALPAKAERRIYLKVWVKSGYLIVKCENTARHGVAYRDGKPFSTKDKAGHGWGLGILEDMARRYDGELHTAFQDGIFLLRETLKLNSFDCT